MTKIRVLLTGVGGPTPRSIAISLKKYSEFKNIELFATDVNPYAIGLYLPDVFKKSFIVPAYNEETYWESIHKIIEQNNIEFAFVSPELEVMEWARRKESHSLPCKTLIPDIKIAEAVYSKQALVNNLSAIGLVPKSKKIDATDFESKELFNYFDNSFWVRSSTGSSGLAAMHVKTMDDLNAWVKINPQVESFLASQYLPGRNLACKLLYFDGNLIRAACVERNSYIMAKTSVSGITGNVSRGTFINEEDVVERADRALQYLFSKFSTKAHGFFTVDLKEDQQGIPLITEINIRHIATTQCFAAGGANFAEDTLRLIMEDSDFDRNYSMYKFEKDLMFLREVDTEPILISRQSLLR